MYFSSFVYRYSFLPFSLLSTNSCTNIQERPGAVQGESSMSLEVPLQVEFATGNNMPAKIIIHNDNNRLHFYCGCEGQHYINQKNVVI